MPTSVSIPATQRPGPSRVILRQGWRHMKLSKAVNDFIDSKRPSASPETVRAYESDLGLLTAFARVEAHDTVFDFTPALVNAFFLHQSQRGLAMITLHRYQTSVRAFARWGMSQRLWARNPMDEVAMIRKPKRLPRPFRRAERERLMALQLPLVEQVIRGVLYYTGLRVGPASRIRIRDIEILPETGRGTIRTIGKGRKEHVVPIPRELGLLLQGYLEGQAPRLFLFETPRGKAWDRRAIERVVRGWGALADVEKCTPHRFRHTYATMLFERGGDPRKIQHLLAHADLSTTMLYTEVLGDELADTAQLLEGPGPAAHTSKPYAQPPEGAS
jgi:site-specific recombinase XerD